MAEHHRSLPLDFFYLVQPTVVANNSASMLYDRPSSGDRR